MIFQGHWYVPPTLRLRLKSQVPLFRFGTHKSQQADFKAKRRQNHLFVIFQSAHVIPETRGKFIMTICHIRPRSLRRNFGTPAKPQSALPIIIVVDTQEEEDKNDSTTQQLTLS